MYQEYIAIQKQIDELEEKKKEIRVQIESNLPEDGYKDESITVSWTIKKNWSYTDNVKDLESQMKKKVSEVKKTEEESGLAKLEEVKQLTIRVK